MTNVPTVLLAPCGQCRSKAVATGLDRRGNRMVVCSACGHRARAPESMQPRRTAPRELVEKPYWIRD